MKDNVVHCVLDAKLIHLQFGKKLSVFVWSTMIVVQSHILSTSHIGQFLILTLKISIKVTNLEYKLIKAHSDFKTEKKTLRASI